MSLAARLPLLVVLALGGLSCADRKEEIREAQKRLNAEKKKFEEEAAAKAAAKAPKADRAKLDAPWDDPSYLHVTTGKPCPEGLWAFFEQTPGEGAEVAANEARRAEYLEKLQGATFVTVLQQSMGVTLHAWNAKKKTLTVEVDGVVECFDKLGLLSLAWGTPAKAYRPKGDEEEQLSPQAVWRARSLMFPISFANAAEAKAWAQGPGLTVEARVVFTLGKVELDKHIKKMPVDAGDPKHTQDVDWGAGRLVHVKLVGARLATHFEKDLVAERKP